VIGIIDYRTGNSQSVAYALGHLGVPHKLVTKPSECDDVDKYVLPDYKGAPKPRAIWTTPRGTIEIELYPGDAPIGTDYFVHLVESGDIVDTEVGRNAPGFVIQFAATRNTIRQRDEVNQRGLTRGNLAWASAGLDTGRPGYTLGNQAQPHNEGDFTSLGRVIRGMDVVDRLERTDRITAARMVK